MKKTILMVAIALVTTVKLSAQAENRFWVGGTGKVWFSNTPPQTPEQPESKTRTYNVFPEFGYLLNDRWGVGIIIGYGYEKSTTYLDYSKTDYIDYWDATRTQRSFLDQKSTTKSFKVAPFVRFVALRAKLGGIFLDGGIGYENQNMSTYTERRVEVYNNDELTQNSYQSTEGERNTKTFSAGISPGVSLNLSDRVSLIGKFGFLGYQKTIFSNPRSDYKIKNNDTSLEFDLNSISFGAIVNF